MKQIRHFTPETKQQWVYWEKHTPTKARTVKHRKSDGPWFWDTLNYLHLMFRKSMNDKSDYYGPLEPINKNKRLHFDGIAKTSNCSSNCCRKRRIHQIWLPCDFFKFIARENGTWEKNSRRFRGFSETVFWNGL